MPERGRRRERPDEQDAHLGRRSRRRRREDKRRPVRGLRPKRRLIRLPLRRPGGLHTELPRAADVQGDLRPRQMARLPIPLLQREPRQGRGCAEKAGIHRRNRRHGRAFGGRRQSLQALEGKPQDLRSVGEGRLPRLLPGGHELPLLRPAVRQIRQQIQKVTVAMLSMVREAKENGWELKISSKSRREEGASLLATLGRPYEDVVKYDIDTGEMDYATRKMFARIEYPDICLSGLR